MVRITTSLLRIVFIGERMRSSAALNIYNSQIMLVELKKYHSIRMYRLCILSPRSSIKATWDSSGCVECHIDNSRSTYVCRRRELHNDGDHLVLQRARWAFAPLRILCAYGLNKKSRSSFFYEFDNSTSNCKDWKDASSENIYTLIIDLYDFLSLMNYKLHK